MHTPYIERTFEGEVPPLYEARYRLAHIDGRAVVAIEGPKGSWVTVVTHQNTFSLGNELIGDLEVAFDELAGQSQTDLIQRSEAEGVRSGQTKVGHLPLKVAVGMTTANRFTFRPNAAMINDRLGMIGNTFRPQDEPDSPEVTFVNMSRLRTSPSGNWRARQIAGILKRGEHPLKPVLSDVISHDFSEDADRALTRVGKVEIFWRDLAEYTRNWNRMSRAPDDRGRRERDRALAHAYHNWLEEPDIRSDHTGSVVQFNSASLALELQAFETAARWVWGEDATKQEVKRVPSLFYDLASTVVSRAAEITKAGYEIVNDGTTVEVDLAAP